MKEAMATVQKEVPMLLESKKASESEKTGLPRVNHRFQTALYVTGIICVVIASSLTLLYLTTKSNATTDLATAKEAHRMIQTQKQSYEKAVIATFDAATPVRTETATFALG
jgi:hypothetical protein